MTAKMREETIVRDRVSSSRSTFAIDATMIRRGENEKLKLQ